MAILFWPCVSRITASATTTAPLTNDAHIVGHPLADLWISSTTNDADVFVYLEDVSASGQIDDRHTRSAARFPSRRAASAVPELHGPALSSRQAP